METDILKQLYDAIAVIDRNNLRGNFNEVRIGRTFGEDEVSLFRKTLGKDYRLFTQRYSGRDDFIVSLQKTYAGVQNA